MLCAQKRIIRGTSHERAVSSLWRDERKRILVFFLHRVFLLSRDKIRLVNCLFIMKLHQSWKFHGLFVCFPPEAFKTQCFSIFVTSKINYRQSRKSSNCKIQQRYLLLLCSLLGSTLVIEDLFYLSYSFHLLFLCWATFHYSFMQPKFLLEKNKQTNHNSKVILPWPFAIIFSPVGTWTPAYILSLEQMLSQNYQDIEKHHLHRRI